MMKAAAVKSNKQNESRAAANAVFQKKNNPKGALGFADNRPRPAAVRLKSVPTDPAGSSKFIRLYAPSQVPQVPVSQFDSKKNSIIQLKEKVTLKVKTSKHENAVDQEPKNKEHEVGFRVNTDLEPETKSKYATVDERFDLRQWVDDYYWLAYNNGNYDNSSFKDWGGFQLDSFGFEKAQGEWGSDYNHTWFMDEPGYIGKQKKKKGAAIPATHLLGDYQVKFKWTVTDKGTKNKVEKGPLKLQADPDNSGKIKYTTNNLDENFEV